MNEIIKWLISNYLELLGSVLGVIYVFLSIRQNILTWPSGILTSLFYSYVFFDSGLYAEMGLQTYYVFISIYGWTIWLKGKTDEGKNLNVSVLTGRLAGILLLISILLFVALSILLQNFTNSTVPFSDALITALSIVATWMLARKILEHWLIWIFVDLFSIGLFWYKGLYPTIILFVVYTIMAILGYFEWKKSIPENK